MMLEAKAGRAATVQLLVILPQSKARLDLYNYHRTLNDALQSL